MPVAYLSGFETTGQAGRGYPLSIIYGDLNELKEVNDRFGHNERDTAKNEMYRDKGKKSG